MLTKEISDYLQSLDVKIEAFDGFSGEHSIGQGIKDIMTKQGTTYEPTVEDTAERAAFDFTQDYPGDGAGWGTYYGPMFILEDPKNKGVMNEYPSINRINQEVIEYWHTRALESINPILKTRYADLVIDFSGRVLGKKMDFQEMCKILIRSSIEICDNGYLHGILCRTKIERALHMAILLGDKALIIEVKEAIIRLEERTGTDDDSPGLWGYAFDLLVLSDDFKEKVEITEDEKNHLIEKLELRLARLKGNPNSLDRAVTLLAEHYSSQKDEGNLMRVLNINEESQIGNDKNIEEPLLRINAYNRIRQIYQMYGDRGFPSSKEAEKRILNEMGRLDMIGINH